MKLSKKIAILFVFCIASQITFSQSLEELKRLQDEYNKVLERQSLQKSDEIQEEKLLMRSRYLSK